MLEQECLPACNAESSSEEDPKLKWAALIPVVCVGAMVFTLIETFPSTRGANIEWGGISISSPIPDAKHFGTDGDRMVFQATKPVTIRAAIDGSIQLTPDGPLQIKNKSGMLAVSYTGSIEPTVKDGQGVRRGEAIGTLETNSSSPAKLSLQLFQQGKCISPGLGAAR